MSCENTCYEAVVNTCDEITIKAGLPPSTAYFVAITRVGQTNVYQRQFSTDADGILSIIPETFPAGDFAIGSFNLVLKTTDGNYTVQPLTFSGKQYSCVIFQVKKVNTAEGDTSPISTIQ